VRVVGTARIQSQGSTLVTNNPLDIAIEGEGYFVVQQPDGTPAYTRAGALQKDAQGQLVNPEGMPIDPPILVPQDSIAVNIGSDGTVTAMVQGQTAPVNLGQITLATFVNPTGLHSLGRNLYIPTAASGDPIVGEAAADGRGALLQGAIEKSNVDMVEEMVGLISTQRAYEVNSKVITAADEMLATATQLR
jgi:flagellar basal-body rod protein FlgG